MRNRVFLSLVILLAVFPGPGLSTAGPQPGKAAALKVLVEEDGVYGLTLADLKRAGLALTGRDVQAVKLLNLGKEMPILVEGQGEEGEVLFYGEASRSKYSATNVYWLTVEEGGRRMADLAAPSATPARTLTSWRASQREERNLIYQPNLAQGDRWYWASLTAPNSLNLSLDTPDQAPTEADSTLRVAFMGLTESPANPDHHVQVFLNDRLVSEGSWDGQKAYVAEARFPQSWLKEGGNSLRVTLPGDTGAQAEVGLLDWVEVEYQRRLAAARDQLAFVGQTEGAARYSVQGFTDGQVQVLDITNPDQLGRVAAPVVEPKGGHYSVSFGDDRPGRAYLAFSRKGLKEPKAVLPAGAASLRRPDAGADYLVLAPKPLLKSATSLARWRQGQGLLVKVVDIEEVYDAFGFGLREPQAIKDFLRFAWENWPPPRPAYVLLLGDATYDYRGNLKENSGLIPTYLLSTTHLGETASDNWFVAFGSDEKPSLAIGRLPVRTRAEADKVISKIIANEKGSYSEKERPRALFVADETDPSFEATSETLARDYLPPFIQVSRAYLASIQDPSQTTAQVLRAMGGGLDLLTYVGHGSMEMLGAKKILGSSDLANMPAGKRLPVGIIMTCLAGYFHHPETESIGEQLLLAENKGVVAVLASSGLSLLEDQDLLAKGLFRAIFREGATTLGAAIVKAKQGLPPGASGYHELLETFNLLGDPATVVRLLEGIP